uniref:Uncharacterized protein n=1 Tax=Neogobius melanostomus TaxID=47308 RepID=A0A8C6UAY1_9GOBI
HKLLTDLPDDMLEDSRDSSSPELEYSTCNNKILAIGKTDEMFNSQPHQGQEMDQLQREFLDSTASNAYLPIVLFTFTRCHSVLYNNIIVHTFMYFFCLESADQEQLAQLRILHKAQQRQIEDLEQKLEDSRRNMRYLEHQFAIVKGNLKESSRLVEEHKEREVKMHKSVKALEHQVQLLTEKDQENMKKQRMADAAVDTMKQQMLEMCRSDTLSRTREQHDRDITVMREQHETALLTSQQKIDSISQALNEQVDLTQRLREQVKQLERQREEDQLDRARVINGLTQRLEESQQQCAKLLQTSSVQEMSRLQIKLQQTQSAKALSENMNKALEEDLAELKEQITLYESAVKHNVISLDLSNNLENHLSESCIDLGLKKANLKNVPWPTSEVQRCLGNLKGKRLKIEQLQEELRHSRTRVDELQTQLEEAKLCSEVGHVLKTHWFNWFAVGVGFKTKLMLGQFPPKERWCGSLKRHAAYRRKPSFIIAVKDLQPLG